jgi:ParB family chromosome partitioning protein
LFEIEEGCMMEPPFSYAPRTSPVTEAVQFINPWIIDPSPYQPRRRFDEAQLAELAESIRGTGGLLQPVIVRARGERFELIAGERRVRASRMVGLQFVAAIVRNFTDREAMTATLVENLQREDISIVEAARAYERLGSEFALTQAEIAQRTGKSRTAINNTLRLLQLPEKVLELVDAGELTEGHARALLGLAYPSLQTEAAEWIVRNGVSVREAEQKIRTLAAEEPGEPKRGKRKKPAPAPADTHVAAVEERLRRHFGTKATVLYQAGRGALTLEFYNDEDLARILELLGLAEGA